MSQECSLKTIVWKFWSRVCLRSSMFPSLLGLRLWRLVNFDFISSIPKLCVWSIKWTRFSYHFHTRPRARRELYMKSYVYSLCPTVRCSYSNHRFLVAVSCTFDQCLTFSFTLFIPVCISYWSRQPDATFKRPATLHDPTTIPGSLRQSLRASVWRTAGSLIL